MKQSGGKKKTNSRLQPLLFTLVFLIFIGIMDYPFVSRIYNERVQGGIAMDYEEALETMEDESLKREWEKAREYNAELAGRGVALQDAFREAQAEPKEYRELLNPGKDGTMALLEIPRIDLSLPVGHGTSEEVLQKGAGHLEGSSLPVGGTDTHTCISAHRGLPNKVMFTNLDQILSGDRFYIKVMGKVLAYEVYAVETAEPYETEALAIRKGEDLATLITCTPYGINTHRLYIHGRRVEEAQSGASGKETAQAGSERSAAWFLRTYGWVLWTVLLLAWMGFLLRRFRMRERTEQTDWTEEGEGHEL